MKNILLLIIIPFLSFGQAGATFDCNTIPDPGTCNEVFVATYYFNQSTLQCEESVWSFCDGLVAFWTLDSCQNYCENSSLIGEINHDKKRLLKKVDLMGRETNNNKGFLLHIYDNGTIEKKYLITAL